MIRIALRLLRHEQAQDTFEYLLMLGFVVALVVGFREGAQILLPGVMDFICPSIDPAGGDLGLDCFDI